MNEGWLLGAAGEGRSFAGFPKSTDKPRVVRDTGEQQWAEGDKKSEQNR